MRNDQNILERARSLLFLTRDRLAVMIQEARVLLGWFVAASWGERLSIFSNAKAVIRLVHVVGIPIERLLAFDRELRLDLYEHYDEIDMVCNAWISWQEFVQCSTEVRSRIVQFALSVRSKDIFKSLREIGFSLDKFLKTPVAMADRLSIGGGGNEVLRLVKTGVPVEEILAIDEMLFSLLVYRVRAVEALHEVGIEWDSLVELGENMRIELASYSAICCLVEAGIAWDSLLTLDQETRLELYKHSTQVRIICREWIPGQDFLQLPKKLRSELWVVAQRIRADDIFSCFKKSGLSVQRFVQLDKRARQELYDFHEALYHLTEAGVSVEHLLNLPADVSLRVFSAAFSLVNDFKQKKNYVWFMQSGIVEPADFFECLLNSGNQKFFESIREQVVGYLRDLNALPLDQDITASNLSSLIDVAKRALEIESNVALEDAPERPSTLRRI